jgi:hypothetical protein
MKSLLLLIALIIAFASAENKPGCLVCTQEVPTCASCPEGYVCKVIPQTCRRCPKARCFKKVTFPSHTSTELPTPVEEEVWISEEQPTSGPFVTVTEFVTITSCPFPTVIDVPSSFPTEITIPTALPTDLPIPTNIPITLPTVLPSNFPTVIEIPSVITIPTDLSIPGISQ